jgi:hypothetical protein
MTGSRRPVLILGLATVLFGVCGSLAQVALRPTPRGPIVPGEYLRNDYIDKVKSTHSHQKALVSGSPQLIVVAPDAAGSLLTAILNFHEGGPDFLLRDGNRLSVREDAGFDLANLTFAVLDGRHFRLGFASFGPQVYTFVGASSVFVAGFTVVGEYLDGKNQHYTFGRDGIASFPGRKFKYTVGTDEVLNRFDYYTDESSHRLFGFRRIDGRLDIFRTSGEMGQDIESRPWLTLNKCCARN